MFMEYYKKKGKERKIKRSYFRKNYSFFTLKYEILPEKHLNNNPQITKMIHEVKNTNTVDKNNCVGH